MHIKDQNSPYKKTPNVKQSPSKRSLPRFIELLHIILMPFQPWLTEAAFDVLACCNSYNNSANEKSWHFINTVKCR